MTSTIDRKTSTHVNTTGLSTAVSEETSSEISLKINFCEPYEETVLPWFLLAAMIAGYLATIGLNDVGAAFNHSEFSKFAAKILDFGLLDKRIFAGELWRLITAPFLHVNFLHLFGNALTFVISCFFLRTIYAGRAWLWIFAVSSILGAMLTLSVNLDERGVGASIGLAGMIGAMLASELLRWHEKLPRSEYPAMMVISLKGLLLMLGLQACVELLLPNIGHVAHLAGLLVGFGMGFCFPRNGKTLVVTNMPERVRAEFPKPIKKKYFAVAYPGVKFVIDRSFNDETDFVGFAYTTRGAFKNGERHEVMFGTSTLNREPEQLRHVLGTQYPPLNQAQVVEAQDKEQKRVLRSKNLPWTIFNFVIALVGAYFFFNSWSAEMVLDVSGLPFLKALPTWLEPSCSYALSHAGAAIISFMTAHVLASVTLTFLQGFVSTKERS